MLSLAVPAPSISLLAEDIENRQAEWWSAGHRFEWLKLSEGSARDEIGPRNAEHKPRERLSSKPRSGEIAVDLNRRRHHRSLWLNDLDCRGPLIAVIDCD
jgi:hypothetical protein